MKERTTSVRECRPPRAALLPIPRYSVALPQRQNGMNGKHRELLTQYTYEVLALPDFLPYRGIAQLDRLALLAQHLARRLVHVVRDRLHVTHHFPWENRRRGAQHVQWEYPFEPGEDGAPEV